MTLRIFTDGEEYVIAETAEEATEIYAKSIGYDDVEKYRADVAEADEEHWRPVPEDRKFRYRIEASPEDLIEHELPAFFCEKYGKGYFASSNA